MDGCALMMVELVRVDSRDGFSQAPFATIGFVNCLPSFIELAENLVSVMDLVEGFSSVVGFVDCLHSIALWELVSTKCFLVWFAWYCMVLCRIFSGVDLPGSTGSIKGSLGSWASMLGVLESWATMLGGLGSCAILVGGLGSLVPVVGVHECWFSIVGLVGTWVPVSMVGVSIVGV